MYLLGKKFSTAPMKSPSKTNGTQPSKLPDAPSNWRREITAGPVANIPDPYCDKYWLVPKVSSNVKKVPQVCLLSYVNGEIWDQEICNGTTGYFHPSVGQGYGSFWGLALRGHRLFKCRVSTGPSSVIRDHRLYLDFTCLYSWDMVQGYG